MTIVDTIADAHYGDRVKLALAFAALLNEEARALEADGVDVIQFDEPAFNVYMDAVTEWGVAALERAAEGLSCTTAVHICYGYGIQANIDWKGSLGSSGASARNLPGARGCIDRSLVPQRARAMRLNAAAGGRGRAG
jgi:5-methyltetrahydropteroyltriglutamate--homocysteine methyltransferase